MKERYEVTAKFIVEIDPDYWNGENTVDEEEYTGKEIIEELMEDASIDFNYSDTLHAYATEVKKIR